MQIHDLNTKALTDPAYVAFDDGTDTYKADFKAEIDNAAADAVADADLTDNTVAFTSGDAASPTNWTAVSVLTSGLTIKVLFNRISTMIKNVRWLYSKLGTTNISSIGDGTVTGAISSLNSNFGGVAFKRLQKAVTIPAGSSAAPALVEIDLSDEISGSVMSVDIWLGTLHLPYTNSSGLVCTWVYDATGKKIRIANAASEWSGYTAYIVVGYLQ